MIISSKNLAYFIAIYSTLMYTGLTIYNTIIVIKHRELMADLDSIPNEEDLEPHMAKTVSVTDFYNYLDELELCTLMLTFSLLLIAGVKLHIYQAMVPWLVLAAIIVVFGFLMGTTTWNAKYTLELVVVVLNAASWIPVYNCYKEMRYLHYFKPKQFVRPNKYSVVGKSKISTTTNQDEHEIEEYKSNI
ncbi:uncharacterized protein LOC142238519 [Haematobia irritans]|uniref:uncharacterized protein LOC142238519 n=1 Tax=Haematobia irritans TaxID=7368 RepID=UPI003F50C1F4